MQKINIDIETFCEADLPKCGVYRYCDHPSFEIQLFSYAVDGGEVITIDLANGEEIPKEIIEAIKDESVIKQAYNAQFERVCLSRYLGKRISAKKWHCTMVHALYLGMGGSLALVGQTLGIEKQKLEEGRDLIRYFAIPCKPTKANGGRTRNYPKDNEEKWERYKAYNRRDVEAEMEISKRMSSVPVPEYIWKKYVLDQDINDRGIAIDIDFVKNAIKCDAELRKKYLDRASYLTGLENPNSPIQLKDWLKSQGVQMEGMTKAEVQEKAELCDGDAKEVLQLRQLLSKSSVKKYGAMEKCRCDDGRAHGLLQFYGANRTGRWAGRLVQVQNLPQNHISDLELARNLIRNGQFDIAELLYDSVPEILSQLIRTAFVPKKGCKFIVADYSAIEARVLSWLAGEKWRCDVFKDNGDIYCASASQMFKVPVEKHGVNGELRAKGKIAELALGYGGSIGALKSMGAIEMGLKEEELKPLVESWRASNPNIVQLWWKVDKAVVKAVKDKVPVRCKNVTFYVEKGILFIQLPSGRRLSYCKPKVQTNDYGRESVSYEGVGSTKKWERIESYGPKFVENIIQGTSASLLAYAMQTLTDEGYEIVMHVHDEVVIEAPMDADMEKVCNLMALTPKWAEGLILNAAGYECEFYKKD